MNLVLSRHGIWYSRYTYLLPSGKRKEIRKSLRTRCKRTAKKLVQNACLQSSLKYTFSSDPVGILDNGSKPSVQSQNDVPKLGKAIDLWIEERRRGGLSDREIRRIKTYTKLLLATVGDKRVDTIGRRDANLFKDALISSDKSITTINNYLKRAKALYEWLSTRFDDLKNPFIGLYVKQAKAPSEQRQAFTLDELKRLHEAAQSLPAHKRMIIMIACYTGMRQNEICQLYKNDIKQVDGIWVIDINDSREEQRLKSFSSKRQIPISSRLIDEGLLSKCVGDGALFPELKHCPERGRARYFSKWYSCWRKRNNLPEFHSIRHTVATKLKSAGVVEQYAAQLLGHADGTITYNRYGKQVEIENLVPLIHMLTDDMC